MGADDRTVDEGHGFRGLLRQAIEDVDPYARLGPSVKPVIDRRVGAVPLRQITPGRAGPQDEEYAVQYPPIIGARHTTRLVRQKRSNDPPFCVAQIKSDRKSKRLKSSH